MKSRAITDVDPAAISFLVASSREHSDQDLASLNFLTATFLAAHGAAPDGLSLEVGTRQGGSAWLFLRLLRLMYGSGDGIAPPLFTVDPYGGKPYAGGDGAEATAGLYGPADCQQMKRLLLDFPNHQHFLLTGTAFLRLAAERYWRNGKSIEFRESITFALLDGDHSAEAIKDELHALFTWGWMKPGGLVAVDDTHKDPKTAAVLQEYEVVGQGNNGLVVIKGKK